MQYGVLRYPHQNARYFEATSKFLENELALILHAFEVPFTGGSYQTIGGMDLFVFESEALSDRVKRALFYMSTAMVFFEVKEGWLKPINEGRKTYFNEDLASILKYNGKTNESFTELMLNVGVFSSKFAKDFDTPLTIFDPMSGKGTSHYKALIKGYHTMGMEQNKNDCVEMNQFLKRYLKYHHYKHDAKHQTIVIGGKQKGTKYTIETADTKEHFKQNDKRVIQFAYGDTRDVNHFYKKNSAHILLTDLPYGVQHGGKSLLKLLEESANAWYPMLKKGGAAVIAYNTHQTSRDVLAKVFSDAGYKVLSEGVYAAFEHWVEQAVNRDIIVAIKE